MLSSMKALGRSAASKSKLLSNALDFVRHGRDLASLGYGMAVNSFTGHTPKTSHEALVSIFTRTGGRTNDKLASIIAFYRRPYDINEKAGVLSPLTDTKLSEIQSTLERDGYYVFDEQLSDAFCDKIAERIADADYIVRGDDIVYDDSKLYKYDRNSPIAANYTMTRDDTTDIPEVQELVSDPTLIRVAQNYLKSRAIFTGLTLGYSARVKDKPDDNAAQTFHWDMERIKWLRFFIYLTDVDEDTGPHCFIKGSHRAGALPEEVYTKGYVRHDDDEVLKIFGSDSYLEFTAKKGTIIAEDSRGLHKGKALKKGERLLLAFELSNSTFGADKRHAIRNLHIPRFAEFAKKYPGLYANFDF